MGERDSILSSLELSCLFAAGGSFRGRRAEYCGVEESLIGVRWAICDWSYSYLRFVFIIQIMSGRFLSDKQEDIIEILL